MKIQTIIACCESTYIPDRLYFCLLFIFIQVIDKSFGFDTAVEEAQRAINAAHVEVESVDNGVGIVKLMGRYSGVIF